MIKAILLAAVNSGNRKIWHILLPTFWLGSNIDELRQIIAPIAREHGVESVSLFGSYSKGMASSGSDVDLIIEKGRLRVYGANRRVGSIAPRCSKATEHRCWEELRKEVPPNIL